MLRTALDHACNLTKFTCRDDSRPALGGIALDGRRVIATDGTSAVIVPLPTIPDGAMAEGRALGSFQARGITILDRGSLTTAFRALPKATPEHPSALLLDHGDREPISATAANGCLGAVVPVGVVEGEYPEIDRVLPSGDACRIGVSAALLKRACEYAIAHGGDTPLLTVELRGAHDPIIVTVPIRDGADTATLIVMPARVDGSTDGPWVSGHDLERARERISDLEIQRDDARRDATQAHVRIGELVAELDGLRKALPAGDPDPVEATEASVRALVSSLTAEGTDHGAVRAFVGAILDAALT